jgi:hypothetical protein
MLPTALWTSPFALSILPSVCNALSPEILSAVSLNSVRFLGGTFHMLTSMSRSFELTTQTPEPIGLFRFSSQTGD